MQDASTSSPVSMLICTGMSLSSSSLSLPKSHHQHFLRDRRRYHFLSPITAIRCNAATFSLSPARKAPPTASTSTLTEQKPQRKPKPKTSPNPNVNRSPSLTENPTPLVSCALQCRHFELCSGCTHEYDLHRPAVLDEAADFFKTLGVSNFTFDSCRLWGWRCRAKLAVRGSSAEPLIGLYQEGTHHVADIPDCRAHHPNINAAVELLKKGITQLNVVPYDEDLGTGELRYVQMAVTTHNTSLPFAERYKNGRVQVTLVWNSRSESSPSSEKLVALSNFLWRNGGPRCKFHLIHSVWANFQTSTSNVIFGKRWRHLVGEKDFWEHFGGIDVSLDPSSFGQANTRAFDSLLRKLEKYVPYGSSVADLYGGAGVIGLSLAFTRKCRSVKCIEINEESKLSFEKTVSRLPECVDSNIRWHHADASIEPSLWLVGSDVVVVDPPRKGLDASLVDALQSLSLAEPKADTSKSSIWKVENEKRPWILRTREALTSEEGKTTFTESQSLPQTLIYISCGWESFKKDCKSLLSKKKWHLSKVHGFNFFPGTQSIEVLAVFKRCAREKLKKDKSGKKKKKKAL